MMKDEDLLQQALLCNILDQLMEHHMNLVLDCADHIEKRFSALQSIMKQTKHHSNLNCLSLKEINNHLKDIAI